MYGTPDLPYDIYFLYLWWFLGWISAKLALVENAFATRQLPLLATSIAFRNILTRACAEITILSDLHL